VQCKCHANSSSTALFHECIFSTDTFKIFLSGFSWIGVLPTDRYIGPTVVGGWVYVSKYMLLCVILLALGLWRAPDNMSSSKKSLYRLYTETFKFLSLTLRSDIVWGQHSMLGLWMQNPDYESDFKAHAYDLHVETMLVFFFYYSYVHTKLGSFLPPAPTPSLTTHSTPFFSPPPPQYPAETILPLSLILL
jgi:hypothetical protein